MCLVWVSVLLFEYVCILWVCVCVCVSVISVWLRGMCVSVISVWLRGMCVFECVVATPIQLGESNYASTGDIALSVDRYS